MLGAYQGLLLGFFTINWHATQQQANWANFEREKDSPNILFVCLVEVSTFRYTYAGEVKDEAKLLILHIVLRWRNRKGVFEAK